MQSAVQIYHLGSFASGQLQAGGRRALAIAGALIACGDDSEAALRLRRSGPELRALARHMRRAARALEDFIKTPLEMSVPPTAAEERLAFCRDSAGQERLWLGRRLPWLERLAKDWEQTLTDEVAQGAREDDALPCAVQLQAVAEILLHISEALEHPLAIGAVPADPAESGGRRGLEDPAQALLDVKHAARRAREMARRWRRQEAFQWGACDSSNALETANAFRQRAEYLASLLSGPMEALQRLYDDPATLRKALRAQSPRRRPLSPDGPLAATLIELWGGFADALETCRSLRRAASRWCRALASEGEGAPEPGSPAGEAPAAETPPATEAAETPPAENREGSPGEGSAPEALAERIAALIPALNDNLDNLMNIFRKK